MIQYSAVYVFKFMVPKGVFLHVQMYSVVLLLNEELNFINIGLTSHIAIYSNMDIYSFTHKNNIVYLLLHFFLTSIYLNVLRFKTKSINDNVYTDCLITKMFLFLV